MLVITLNLDLNNVKLVKDKYQIKNIFIDDKEIKGVTKITYTEETDAVNTIIIEMLMNKLEIEDINEKETQTTQKQKKWLIVYVTELGSAGIYESFTDKETAEWRLSVAKLNAKKYNSKLKYFIKECEVEL